MSPALRALSMGVALAAGLGAVVSCSAAGTTRISAEGPTVRATSGVAAPVLHVEPATDLLDAGTTRQLRLVALEADGRSHPVTSGATWHASGDALRVDSSGFALALVAGRAEVTATYGGVTAPAAVITVRSRTLTALRITPAALTIHASDPAEEILNVTAYYDDGADDVTRYARWTSSAPAVASIGDTPEMRGRLRAGAVTGSASVTAVFRGMSAPPVLVSVLPNVPVTSIELTTPTQPLAAGYSSVAVVWVTYANGVRRALTSSFCAWSSTRPAVATVNSDGVITAIAAGTTTITATLEGVASGHLNFAVSPAE